MALETSEAYATPGEGEHERAVFHRARALDALDDPERGHAALTHAILAVEARLEELACYLAR